MRNTRNPQLKIRSDVKDAYLNYRLRNARIRKGYTITQLGRVVGVDYSTICAYERLRCMPSKKIASKVANALGTTIKNIFPEKIRSITEEIEKERRREDIIFEELYEQDVSYEQKHEFVEEDFLQRLGERMQDAFNHAELDKRQRQVLTLRYGIGCDPKTLEEIGKEINCTRRMAGQIEIGAIKKLQKYGRRYIAQFCV